MAKQKKTLDIQRSFNKRSFVLSKEKMAEIFKRHDLTWWLEQESHYDNGESELVIRLHIAKNLD